MRTILLVGSVVAGVLLFIYENYYKERPGEERPHGAGGGGGGGGSGRSGRAPSDEEYIEINSTLPREQIPAKDDICPICQERLYLGNSDRRYCLARLPDCGHWFHQRCALRLLEYCPMCPVCRIPIDPARLRTAPVRVSEAGDEN